MPETITIRYRTCGHTRFQERMLCIVAVGLCVPYSMSVDNVRHEQSAWAQSKFRAIGGTRFRLMSVGGATNFMKRNTVIVFKYSTKVPGHTKKKGEHIHIHIVKSRAQRAHSIGRSKFHQAP